MAAVVLGGKVEEEPRRVRDVVLAFVHLYRRRRLRVGESGANPSLVSSVGRSGGKEGVVAGSSAESDLTRTLGPEERLNVLRHVRPLHPGSQTYKAWSRSLLDTENSMLRSLGFTLYWIPDSHPHKFILYFLRVLELDGSTKFAQLAWNYCNDASRMDVAVRYEAEIVACAAIYMAANDASGGDGEGVAEGDGGPVDLPLKPRPWWEAFVGPNRDVDLSDVCNAILAAMDSDREENRIANRRFVSSLVPGGSFNDPGSFLWSLAD